MDQWRRMIFKMFYRESYNNLWYEKNPQIIEIFDHLLGTLVGDIVNRITVSFIAEKTGMQYEMAKQIVIYYRDVGILKERYVVLCPKRGDILFISDKEDLLEKIQKKPIYFECENNDYGQISMSNVFLVYERVKKSTTSQEEVNETLIKFGDILRVKKDDSFFDKADSLQSNTEELYELYYIPSESAYANFADLTTKFFL